MCSRKNMSLLCAALLMVGLSFGEASAIQFDFTGYVTSTGVYNNKGVTGYFEYDPLAAGTGSAPKIYTNIAEFSLTLLDPVGSLGFTFTDPAADVVVYNNAGTTGDRFRVSTATPNPSTNVVYVEFQNKNFVTNPPPTPPTVTVLDNLLSSTALPDDQTYFFNFLASRDQNNPPYSELLGYYKLGTDNTKYFGFRITEVAEHVTEPTAPVPEPATMFLLGSGLIGIGAFARKRFKK
jgi:hypothetical protein